MQFLHIGLGRATSRTSTMPQAACNISLELPARPHYRRTEAYLARRGQLLHKCLLAGPCGRRILQVQDERLACRHPLGDVHKNVPTWYLRTCAVSASEAQAAVVTSGRAAAGDTREAHLDAELGPGFPAGRNLDRVVLEPARRRVHHGRALRHHHAWSRDAGEDDCADYARGKKDGKHRECQHARAPAAPLPRGRLRRPHGCTGARTLKPTQLNPYAIPISARLFTILVQNEDVA